MGTETKKEQKLNAMKTAYEKNSHAYNQQRLKDKNADLTEKRADIEKSMQEIVKLEIELYGDKACSADSPSILLQRHEYSESSKG